MHPWSLCFDDFRSHFFFSSDFKCMEALGMESGEIHSDQITASSQYSTNWSAERSRLHYPENGWTPGEDSYREWIQVRISTLWRGKGLGHQKRSLKRSLPWQRPSHEKGRRAPGVITLQNSWDQRKADPNDVPENPHLRDSHLTLPESARMSYVGHNWKMWTSPTATYFLWMCFLLQQMFISLMKYVNSTCRCAWNHCFFLRRFAYLFVQDRS